MCTEAHFFFSSSFLSFFQDGFVRVRKRDLEKLTTEVMQLKEFLPRILSGDLVEMQHKARAAQTGTLPFKLDPEAEKTLMGRM